MIPLYDTVRSHKFPLVTLTIIAVNILAFFHETRMASPALEEFVYTWGLIPSRFLSDPSAGWLLIFTSMFLHGGWFHIISNMWVLFLFGANVEARMGGIRYLVFYLLCGAAAALMQSYILPASDRPMIGASGAIAGVLGAYLILFPRARIASLVPILFIFTIVELPAVIFLAFWFISQLFSGWLMLSGGTGSGIAWWAHIGGFLFGMAAGPLLAPRRRFYSPY